MHFSDFSRSGIILTLIIAVLSVARTARLLVHDEFPPVAALRSKIQHWLANGDRRMKWLPLTECPFCITPYLAAGMVAWAWLSDLNWFWYLVNGWWALSYAAAIVVARDEQPE